MARRALLVGIDEYDHIRPLRGCVNDARAVASTLARHADGSINFDCRVLTSPGADRLTRAFLRQQWNELFDSFDGDLLFYFSGHGAPTSLGGFLATQDAATGDPGLPMNDVVTLANRSQARTVLVILDCCFSGSAGNPPNLQGDIENQAQLREGVTILAASRPTQPSVEVGGHGVFTKFILGALNGGAADVRGRVSAASVYAYAEAALGAWDQRPLYKSHAAQLDPIRLCEPKVSDTELRELPSYFAAPDSEFRLDPTYEETNRRAIAANVAVFKRFKRLQIAGLLYPNAGPDLYWAAERSDTVRLTQLGQFYWQLVTDGRI